MTSFPQGVKPKPLPRPKPPRPGQATYYWEGCYNDKRRRAIRYRLGNFHRRRDPVSACAAAALRRRFKVFAVENGGECYSGRSAHRTYNRYGPTNRCKRGRGGPWAMDVYKFGQRMSYVELSLLSQLSWQTIQAAQNDMWTACFATKCGCLCVSVTL